MSAAARLLPPLLAAAAAPAGAAERRVALGSFERVRVQGPLAVTVAAARAPGATVTGDAAAIEAVEVAVDGGTLTVRAGPGRWGERPAAARASPVAVALGTDTLAGASVTGGGALRVERMRAARVDLSLTGGGTIAVADVEADAVVATLIGAGAMTLAGRAGGARLLTNGAGTIDAAELDAGDLTVRLDGPGTTAARARYTAKVTDTGLGRVTVAGSPKCSVAAAAGGPVTCGAER